MSRPPRVFDADTGEELLPNFPLIPKFPSGPLVPKGPTSGPLVPKGPTSGPLVPSSINNNSGGMSGFNVEGAKAAVETAQFIWNSLTPKQQEKVIKVATKAPQEAISNLRYIPEAFSSLGKIFFPSKRSRKGAGKNTIKNAIDKMMQLINTNEGQFTVVNEPSSGSSSGSSGSRGMDLI